jgi:dihydrofolate reductase
MSFARPARLKDVTRTTAHVSISLDGFIAGPDQDRENPLGLGGRQLHDWHLNEEKTEADAALTAELLRPRGAFVMGRNMYGPIRGEWDEDWCGWWGEDPPYHAPVFVLTHYAHDPIEMAGGTTFHFVPTASMPPTPRHRPSLATATSRSRAERRRCARL